MCLASKSTHPRRYPTPHQRRQQVRRLETYRLRGDCVSVYRDCDPCAGYQWGCWFRVEGGFCGRVCRDFGVVCLVGAGMGKEAVNTLDNGSGCGDVLAGPVVYVWGARGGMPFPYRDERRYSKRWMLIFFATVTSQPRPVSHQSPRSRHHTRIFIHWVHELGELHGRDRIWTGHETV